ncbi:MAG TPA: hypothetical protein VGB20_01685 [bacterium]
MPDLLTALTALAGVAAIAALAGAVKTRGLLRRLRRVLAAVVLGAVACLGGAGVAFRHAFLTFTGETLVATVSVDARSGDDFTLTYAPAGGGPATVALLRGDQWAVSGGIVIWHPVLGWAGVRSYHRPARLSGRFSKFARELDGAPSGVPLAEGPDWMWEWLYRLDKALPLVDTAYGTSAYAYADPGPVYEVLVSRTGYVIRRRKS